jgi:hypothetical protein
VNADPLRRQRARHEQHQDDREQVLRDHASVGVHDGHAPQQRSHGEEHGPHVDEHPADHLGPRQEAPGVTDRGDHREKTPAHDVVECRAGDGQRPQTRVQQVTLDEDAGEDGKRRDRHRRAEKACEAEARHVRSSELRV